MFLTQKPVFSNLVKVTHMQYIPQILFIIISGVSIYLFAKKVGEIRRNILLGRDEDLTDNSKERWKNMVLLALGQKKMFKRPVPAILHLFVYLGFVIINIEILEIILDGILGQHRLFVPLLGQKFYSVLIGCFEILAALVLIGCVIFLIRRNIVKVPRLIQGELKGWPKNDANIILITEVILMGLFLAMNTADLVLQSRGVEHYTLTEQFWISGNLTSIFSGLSNEALIAIERGGWWLHIIGVLAFMNYLPYSKHFHILLAFPNAYYMRLKNQGEAENMEDIQKEVLYMMEPEKAPTDAAPAEAPRFGAKDVTDLSWKNLMDAYACTECGRCTANCPANQTGKTLSPRKIMMDTRDRLEEVGANINKNKEFVDDGKTLVHDYISVEELRACTTCQACVEACPVSIDPLNIIYQLRRYLIMEESNSPEEWNMMFGNVETSMSPWKFSPDDRDKWVEEMAEA